MGPTLPWKKSLPGIHYGYSPPNKLQLLLGPMTMTNTTTTVISLELTVGFSYPSIIIDLCQPPLFLIHRIILPKALFFGSYIFCDHVHNILI